MKPLFTIHAGEYLVGSYIESHYPKWNVWIPSKDTGIDFLITNAKNTKTVSLQVKFSKDFNPTHRKDFLKPHLKAAGWWSLQADKIRNSPADLWVFVLPSFTDRQDSFILIPPAELLRRLRSIHGKSLKRIQSYLWITRKKQCWEARGLNKVDQEKIAFNCYSDKERDFSSFLNNWKSLEQLLK